MGMSIYVKDVLFFILEYMYFLKNDIFGFSYNSGKGAKNIEINFANAVRKNDDVDALEGGKPLKTYKNDYKPRASTTDEAEVCNDFVNIASVIILLNCFLSFKS